LFKFGAVVEDKKHWKIITAGNNMNKTRVDGKEQQSSIVEIEIREN